MWAPPMPFASGSASTRARSGRSDRCGRLVQAKRRLKMEAAVAADGGDLVDQALALDLLFLGQALRVVDFPGHGGEGGEGHAMSPLDAAVLLAALAVAAPAGRVGPVEETGPGEILLDVRDRSQADAHLPGKLAFLHPDGRRTVARLEVEAAQLLERHAEITDVAGLQVETLLDVLKVIEKPPMVEARFHARPGLGGVACSIPFRFVDSAPCREGAARGVAASGAACSALI